MPSIRAALSAPAACVMVMGGMDCLTRLDASTTRSQKAKRQTPRQNLGRTTLHIALAPRVSSTGPDSNYSLAFGDHGLQVERGP